MKNNNKIFGFTLIMMLMVNILFAQQNTAESDFSVMCSNNGNSVIITGYTGKSNEVNIPSHIRGLPVTGIGESAFANNPLTIVEIHGDVTSMGQGCFRYMVNYGSMIMDRANIEKIIIGKNIDFGPSNFFRDVALPANFVKLYNQAGKRAGTYILENDSWNEIW